MTNSSTLKRWRRVWSASATIRCLPPAAGPGASVEKAGEGLRVARANRELKRQLDEKFGFEGVVGNSPKMHKVIDQLRTLAPTSATVLIHGETGTGKELVAKAIHNNSPR